MLVFAVIFGQVCRVGKMSGGTAHFCKIHPRLVRKTEYNGSDIAVPVIVGHRVAVVLVQFGNNNGSHVGGNDSSQQFHTALFRPLSFFPFLFFASDFGIRYLLGLVYDGTQFIRTENCGAVSS